MGRKEGEEIDWEREWNGINKPVNIDYKSVIWISVFWVWIQKSLIKLLHKLKAGSFSYIYSGVKYTYGSKSTRKSLIFVIP